MSFVDKLWDGTGNNYSEAFSIQVIKSLSILASCVLIIPILLTILIHFMMYRQKKVPQVSIQDSLFQKPQSIQHSQLSKVMDCISVVLFWVAICMYSLCFPFLQAFRTMSDSLCGFLLLSIYTCGILFQIWRHTIYEQGQHIEIRIKQSCYSYRWLLGIQTTILISACIAIPFLFQKGCVCVYSSGYGLPILLDLTFSTAITRGYWLPDQVCPSKQVCHVYATLPQNTMNEVFINIHTATDIPDTTLYISGPNYYKQQICQQIPIPSDIEYRGQRNLFTCLVTQLNSNTIYDIVVMHRDTRLYSIQYKTLPSRDDKQRLKMLFGGDFGYLQQGFEIVDTINQVDPDVILIGGDVAYDNGNYHCYYSYDLFLSLFETEFQANGRLIPFIFSVGNHDVGFNDYANYNITVSDEYGPLYFTYFPQKSINDRVPNVNERVTFNYHLMQHLIVFGLDTGYLHPHNGIQTTFIEQSLIDNPTFYPFAHYHVPMYPTCFANSSFMARWEGVSNGHKYWVPLFDKYNFVAAFENHVHQYKRTFPLKGGKTTADLTGTVYFGDGSMGVVTETCKPDHRTFKVGGVFEGLFDQSIVEDSAHYWVMTVEQDKTIEYRAYTPKFVEIDKSEYKQDLKLRQIIRDDL